MRWCQIGYAPTGLGRLAVAGAVVGMVTFIFTVGPRWVVALRKSVMAEEAICDSEQQRDNLSEHECALSLEEARGRANDCLERIRQLREEIDVLAMSV